MSILTQGIKDVASFRVLHHKKTEEHGTFSHIHIQKSRPFVLGTHTINHHPWSLKATCSQSWKICSYRCMGLLLHSRSVISIFFWCWAIWLKSTTLNLAHNTQQIVVFRSGLLAGCCIFILYIECWSWIEMGLQQTCLNCLSTVYVSRVRFQPNTKHI